LSGNKPRPSVACNHVGRVDDPHRMAAAPCQNLEVLQTKHSHNRPQHCWQPPPAQHKKRHLPVQHPPRRRSSTRGVPDHLPASLAVADHLAASELKSVKVPSSGTNCRMSASDSRVATRTTSLRGRTSSTFQRRRRGDSPAGILPRVARGDPYLTLEWNPEILSSKPILSGFPVKNRLPRVPKQRTRHITQFPQQQAAPFCPHSPGGPVGRVPSSDTIPHHHPDSSHSYCDKLFKSGGGREFSWDNIVPGSDCRGPTTRLRKSEEGKSASASTTLASGACGEKPHGRRKQGEFLSDFATIKVGQRPSVTLSSVFSNAGGHFGAHRPVWRSDRKRLLGAVLP
jgi:hypothetical protein